jgi:flagellar capping protein FliD
MSTFKKAMSNLADAVQDLSKLDVITFQGSVTLENDANHPVSFSEVMTQAKGNATVKVKVLASTQTCIDGDIVAFYDTNITEAERMAHADLVQAGAESRKATIDFVKSIVGDISNL